jgi:membrane glycosyltransferase
LSGAAASIEDCRLMALTLRWVAFAVSGLAALFAAWLFVLLARADGWTSLDSIRLVLSSLCVFWLAWGTMSGILGLLPLRPELAERPGPDRPHRARRTALLMPIYHEDPPSTFARVAAMSARLTAIGAHGRIDIFILSDSQSPEAAAREALWFERLLADCAAREQVFYRRRDRNNGRKAGNVEDFIRRSGGAYDYALVLDADSLMEANAIVGMIARMEATPDLGLLQSLPLIVNAHSIFGRVLQFSANLYTPVFARGTALLQGRDGPYWGHNAIFRVDAFAQSCGLPELSGKPPFGGQILSHDYVEAALLARAGYEVRLDPEIGGSFEEGPDNLVDFAKRDQRWCQGNLQHMRVLLAPDLHPWNRITLLQGIFNYLMPPVWLVLLIVSIAAADMARIGRNSVPPGWVGWGLIGSVTALLVLPKLLIAASHIASGRVAGFKGGAMLLLSVLAELVLSTLTAPIVLMFQVRAVLRVLSGFDGGWPASNRTGSVLTLRQAWASAWWISCCGGVALAVVLWASPALVIWSLPVALPMILAPLLISVTSLPLSPLAALWRVPHEIAPAPVLREWQAIHARWTGTGDRMGPHLPDEEAANVLG